MSSKRGLDLGSVVAVVPVCGSGLAGVCGSFREDVGRGVVAFAITGSGDFVPLVLDMESVNLVPAERVVAGEINPPQA